MLWIRVYSSNFIPLEKERVAYQSNDWLKVPQKPSSCFWAFNNRLPWPLQQIEVKYNFCIYTYCFGSEFLYNFVSPCVTMSIFRAQSQGILVNRFTDSLILSIIFIYSLRKCKIHHIVRLQQLLLVIFFKKVLLASKKKLLRVKMCNHWLSIVKTRTKNVHKKRSCNNITNDIVN